MNVIQLRDVTKHYRHFTLGPLTLALPQGCIMGLVGENGAGKSTTIKLLLDAIKKDGGELVLQGQNGVLSKEDIGVVLDEVGISGCLTPKQVGHIMRHTFSNWDEALYRDYLKRFSLAENKKFNDFSRGMKMKLGIAVALSHHPKLLILDEATAGLDPVVRDEILDIFLDFARDENHSILISSHIVSDLEKICDYIAFLHEGKLLLCEEKDTLREQYGLWQGSEEQFRQLDPTAVVGQKKTAYGVQAMVKKEAVDGTLLPINIEDLFIFMTGKGRA